MFHSVSFESLYIFIGGKKFIVGGTKLFFSLTLLYRDYADWMLPSCAEKVDIYLITVSY